MTYEDIPAEKLGVGCPIAVEIVDEEIDLYWAIALDMAERVRVNNAKGQATVFIVPVGPVGQYRRFASICNKERLDLSRVHFINMDEYLDEEWQWIEYSSPFSFRRFMDEECYGRLDPSIVMPAANRIFPEPGKEEKIQHRIDELGGVDTCYGGVGINGHIAFNEPPEKGDAVSVGEFASRPTRVLFLSRETRTINSVTAASVYIDLIPPRCITVGMKEILSARRIRLYMNREWQKGIVRKLLHGGIDPLVPASLLALHRDAKLTITSTVAQKPLGRLR
ncbi:MAG: glucosamine-6-phosphate isomerase [Spirochaetes bacterium]|nr:glucosamine-6-phosphate isomerase [Spirochaetota bacterium]